MDLIKDEGIDEMKQMFYSGFCSKDGDNSIYFDGGKIEATAYSYEIGSTGTVELNGEQTLELYLAMKKFYDSIG